MKCLQIESAKGYFSVDGNKWILLDQITKEDILKVTLDFCSSVLEKNPPETGYEKVMEAKNTLQTIRTIKKPGRVEEESLEKDDLVNAIKKIEKKKKKCYEFITKT